MVFKGGQVARLLGIENYCVGHSPCLQHPLAGQTHPLCGQGGELADRLLDEQFLFLSNVFAQNRCG